MHPVLGTAPPYLAKEEGVTHLKRTKLNNEQYRAYSHDRKTNRIRPLSHTDPAL
jgi:hypothetical protein